MRAIQKSSLCRGSTHVDTYEPKAGHWFVLLFLIYRVFVMRFSQQVDASSSQAQTLVRKYVSRIVTRNGTRLSLCTKRTFAASCVSPVCYKLASNDTLQTNVSQSPSKNTWNTFKTFRTYSTFEMHHWWCLNIHLIDLNSVPLETPWHRFLSMLFYLHGQVCSNSLITTAARPH